MGGRQGSLTATEMGDCLVFPDARISEMASRPRRKRSRIAELPGAFTGLARGLSTSQRDREVIYDYKFSKGIAALRCILPQGNVFCFRFVFTLPAWAAGLGGRCGGRSRRADTRPGLPRPRPGPHVPRAVPRRRLHFPHALRLWSGDLETASGQESAVCGWGGGSGCVLREQDEGHRDTG